jgi:hypothetical protein
MTAEPDDLKNLEKVKVTLPEMIALSQAKIHSKKIQLEMMHHSVEILKSINNLEKMTPEEIELFQNKLNSMIIDSEQEMAQFKEYEKTIDRIIERAKREGDKNSKTD